MGLQHLDAAAMLQWLHHTMRRIQSQPGEENNSHVNVSIRSSGGGTDVSEKMLSLQQRKRRTFGVASEGREHRYLHN